MDYESCKKLELETELRSKIKRDLAQVAKNAKTCNTVTSTKVTSHPNCRKDVIRAAMAHKRNEYLQVNSKFIIKNLDVAKNNLALGQDVLCSKIKPVVEVCQTQEQNQLFWILRCYWSSPYSDYVGRRIKLIVRDYGLKSKPVIGIAALGSPIIHIAERDEFVGWDKITRTDRLNFMMDAYIVGALPPYNHLLGGKLVSYILVSREVRCIYEEKYKDRVTHISCKKRNKLAGIFTTGLFGNSSQYNRLKYKEKLIYIPVGYTKGVGTHHLTAETIGLMRDFLKSKNVYMSHKFGAGPNYVMRAIRKTGEILGLDGDVLLSHSFKRRIYFSAFAENTLEFLRGETEKLIYHNWAQKELVDYWKKRWLSMRLENSKVVDDVRRFHPKDFDLSYL